MTRYIEGIRTELHGNSGQLLLVTITDDESFSWCVRACVCVHACVRAWERERDFYLKADM